ncbi:hypothetical protein [Paenibacillus xylaniclasticus]|uniref:hypothetical protein n=1 Tax=Paenibacillus xylaniclasticus TaxID=588083 RepID=UPI000FDC01DB|nr:MULTISPECIES: hypothetical protein [Paenibacillus]GFN32179.1 hypothetical protein PCURB6_24390 [Paenibacillus curdlanolyticus]
MIDALVGNIKNNVTLSESSGGEKSVDVTLTGAQVPTAASVIGSLIVKEVLSGKDAPDSLFYNLWRNVYILLSAFWRRRLL